MSVKPITGRKVFIFTASAFALIIGVNLFMAWSAIRTFPGLEVKNTYVASQSFDADRAAQEALGWTVDAQIEGDEIVLRILDGSGLPAELEEIEVSVGRPTHVRDDFTPEFVLVGNEYRAPAVLNPGSWHLRLKATAADGTRYHRRLAMYRPRG